MGISLSVCMIVRDEAPVLARCLEGVRRFADELIIVDTGSVDETREIALGYTSRVYDFPWCDDFSAARNAAYSYATGDYVMWLDADDVVSPEDGQRLKELKQTLPRDTDVVYLLYGGDTDQNNIYHNTLIFRDRWFRRSLDPRWQGRLHEFIPIPADAKEFYADQIRLRHCKLRVNDPDRNMRIHRLCLAEQKEPVVRDMGFLCNEYYAAGSFSQAVEVFQALTRQIPFPKFDICNALFSYIWSMKQLKKTDELIEMLLALKAQGVVNELLLCELGAAYLTRKDDKQAERYLLDALAVPIDYRDMAVHFEAYHEFLPCQKLSKLYSLQGKQKLSYAYFLRAERIYPENRSIRLNRLYFAQSKGKNKDGTGEDVGQCNH